MRRSTRYALLLSFTASLAACAPKLYTPTEINAQKRGFPLAELASGRVLYMNECGECHKLYVPTRYTTEEWTEHLDVMAPKAKINSDQKRLIYQYLVSEVPVEK